LIDVSGSNHFGTTTQLKQEVITELAALLAFSAIQNNDKVGVIFFSDHVEKFIPPKKGTSHILRIIRELIDFKPEHQGTNIAEALRYFTNAIKKRCTAFLLSDFIDKGFENAIKIANNKHDLIAVQIYDERETEIPDVGMVRFKNSETGKQSWVDTSDARVRSQFKAWNEKRNQMLSELFVRSGVDVARIKTDQDYVKPLVNLFKIRGARK
ncbi:MAG: VWA domain-containing protein, partial [Bacteroidota bacterium]